MVVLAHTKPREDTGSRTSLRQETGSYVPRQYNSKSRERFLRNRRQTYLARVSGRPSTAQVAMVLTLARLDWNALKAEHENTLQGDREGRASPFAGKAASRVRGDASQAAGAGKAVWR